MEKLTREDYIMRARAHTHTQVQVHSVSASPASGPPYAPLNAGSEAGDSRRSSLLSRLMSPKSLEVSSCKLGSGIITALSLTLCKAHNVCFWTLLHEPLAQQALEVYERTLENVDALVTLLVPSSCFRRKVALVCHFSALFATL